MVKPSASVAAELDSLSEALAGLSPRLVDTAGCSGARALLSRYAGLPEASYLECRSEGGAPQVDVLMAVTRSRRYTLRQALAASGDENVEATALQRLVERWISPASVLGEALPLIWLELDDVGRAVHWRPNVCACLEPGYIEPLQRLPRQRSRFALPIAMEFLQVLLGETESEAARAIVQHHILEAPEGAHWIHLSVMQARRPHQLKLYGAFPRAELLPYLARTSWPGDVHRVAEILERYAPEERTGDILYVDLPLQSAPAHRGPVSSRLGLNFSQQQLAWAAEQDPTRAELLALLVRDGICEAAKAAAYRGWPKVYTVGDWQASRWLDVKLVCTARQPIRAKGYLGFGSRRLPRASPFERL